MWKQQDITYAIHLNVNILPNSLNITKCDIIIT